MIQRGLAVLVVVVGVALGVTTFANDLFNVGPAFEELTDGFRPKMTDESIGALQADLELLGQVPTEFGAVAQALAPALGMDGQQLNEFLGQQFPQVTAGVAALPEIVPNFTGLIGTLDAQQENFAGADAIPTDSLPATTVPWGLLGVGLVIIAIGVLMFLRFRQGSLAAIGLGAIVIIAVLLLSLIGKAKDADDLNDALRPVYTEATVAGGQQALGVVSAMGQQMQGEMLPGIAQQLGRSGDEVGAMIAQASPTIAQALQTFPEALGRFDSLLAAFDSNLDNYDVLEPVSFSPIIWTLFAAGILTLLAGGAGLVFGRRAGVTGG